MAESETKLEVGNPNMTSAGLKFKVVNVVDETDTFYVYQDDVDSSLRAIQKTNPNVKVASITIATFIVQ